MKTKPDFDPTFRSAFPQDTTGPLSYAIVENTVGGIFTFLILIVGFVCILPCILLVTVCAIYEDSTRK